MTQVEFPLPPHPGISFCRDDFKSTQNNAEIPRYVYSEK